MFGDAMATHVVCELAGKNATSSAVLPANKKYYLKLMNLFAVSEKEHFGNEKPNLALRDVIQVVDEMWERRSALSNDSRDLVLSRWSSRKPPVVGNLVLLTKKEQQTHYVDNEQLERYPPEVKERVEFKLRTRGFQELTESVQGLEVTEKMRKRREEKQNKNKNKKQEAKEEKAKEKEKETKSNDNNDTNFVNEDNDNNTQYQTENKEESEQPVEFTEQRTTTSTTQLPSKSDSSVNDLLYWYHTTKK